MVRSILVLVLNVQLLILKSKIARNLMIFAVNFSKNQNIISVKRHIIQTVNNQPLKTKSNS